MKIFLKYIQACVCIYKIINTVHPHILCKHTFNFFILDAINRD